MRSILTAIPSRRFARHDQSPSGRPVGPTLRAFFRPESDVRGGCTASADETDTACRRRAFREMSTRLMKNQDQRGALEWVVMGLVIALATWPLIDLLIVLAQTASD